MWFKPVISLLIFILFLSLTDAQEHDNLVQEAWNTWAKNDQAQTEKAFKEIIAKDEKNLRAHLGLSFLYQMQHNFRSSWEHYKYVIENADNPYPYIFAGMHTLKMYYMQKEKDSGIDEMYESLANQNENPLIKANANETLGRYYLVHNDIEKAEEHFAALNTIDDWRICGPFDNISASGFDKTYPPEVEADYIKTYSGKNEIPARWTKISKIRRDRWIDFRYYYAHFESIFYGNTFVYSPSSQKIRIGVGTSGSLKVFLNDDQIYEVFDENNNDLDTYMMETELQKGWNRLLIKCGFSEIDQCNFMVRISDVNGQPVQGLKISSDIQSYPKNPAPAVTIIENFAEAFFKNKIEENPEHIENYLLLADCYLRNDKAIEAELTLRDALKYAPDNTGILAHMIEAYIRGEKNDEISTTYEKIHSLDENIPSALIYKFSLYKNNNDIENAEKTAEKLESLIPNTTEIYNIRFQLYNLKNLPEKLIEIAKEGYEKFPDEWSLAFAQASISIMTKQNYDEAIEIVEKISQNNASEEVLSTLAEIYFRATKVEKWHDTYQRILNLYPAGTGFYEHVSDIYYNLQQYDKAAEYMERTLEICNNHSQFWEKYGKINRALNKNNEAIDSYKKALEYDPANYDARESLRQLQDQKPVFSTFETVDTDELIKKAPDSGVYPEDGAVILLHDIKRVVYPEGASEFLGEELVKVFNDVGIEEFKEDYISFSPYSENLIIEKAVVIKKDGSEIKADIDRNHIVYKSLEPNDFIYLKWKIRNYYNGKLSHHFWDRVIFSKYFPTEDIRYALLLPKNMTFNFKEQNLESAARKKQETTEGVIHQWRLTKQPAVRHEVDMPALVDIGKSLYISSIEDWKYMIDWYLDLARTKTRGSFEIEETVEKLFKDKENLSDLDKIQTVYNYITENIKYSSVSFRQSGLIPQKARDVLVNRIGDCKDVAALCIAMLNELNIKSNYVLVNTRSEGFNRNILPGIEFNHAIVEVHNDGKPMYLDLTAQNYAIGSVPYQDIGAFALPIREGINQPIYLTKDHFNEVKLERKTVFEVAADNSLMVTRTNYRTGIQAAGFRQSYRFIGESEQQRELTQSINNDFPNHTLLDFKIKDLDNVVDDITYTYSFKVADFLTDAGPYKLLRIVFTDGKNPLKSLSYEKREYPIEYDPSTDILTEEITIVLPKGFTCLDLPKPVTLSFFDMQYSLNFTMKDGKIICKRLFKEKMIDILPENYVLFKEFYNAVVKADQTQLLLKTE